MKRGKYAVIATLILAVAVSATLILLRKHFWIRVSDAKVVYNGEASPYSRVFKSVDGDYLVSVRNGPDFGSGLHYYVFRKLRKAGWGAEDYESPWIVFKLDYPSDKGNILIGTEKLTGSFVDNGDRLDVSFDHGASFSICLTDDQACDP